jgi:diguanylate cyclase (GGDEF)-like protein
MNTIRILLVEDDPGHQYLLTRALCDGHPNVHVTVASCKAEFETAIMREEFDCVLLDFHLDGTRGTELIELQRSLNRDFPAIIISGCDQQDIVVNCIRSGGIDFVHKSDAVTGDYLWNRVNVVLVRQEEKRRKRRRARQRERRLIELAQRDHLTGLANRRALDRLIQGEGRETFDRRGDTSVVMVDIDRFKGFNDRYGHDCGDRAICAVADMIRHLLAKSDTAIRYGGEEFLIIRRGKTLENSVRWAETLRNNIAQTNLSEKGESLHLTVSLGLNTVRSELLDKDTITKADEAMYLAKRRGGNLVCTAEMVGFGEIASHFKTTNPYERRDATLAHMKPHLGPTQHEHLTDHSENVSKTASQIGRQLHLLAEDIERLQFSGLCHDLGKMYIPERILAKPEALSDDERYLISLHAQYGADITRFLCDDPITADYVQHHHNRFDEFADDSSDIVPLGARILNAADALVTMISGRPYQPPRTIDAAMQELMGQRGRQFDPTVIDALVNKPATLLC